MPNQNRLLRIIYAFLILFPFWAVYFPVYTSEVDTRALTWFFVLFLLASAVTKFVLKKEIIKELFWISLLSVAIAAHPVQGAIVFGAAVYTCRISNFRLSELQKVAISLFISALIFALSHESLRPGQNFIEQLNSAYGEEAVHFYHRFFYSAVSIYRVHFVLFAITLAIWAYKNIMNNKPITVIHGDSVTATNSTVATGGATIDQSTTINNSGEIGSSISELRSIIDESDLEGSNKKYAKLLLETIESESSKTDKDKITLGDKFSELKSVLESSATIAGTGMKAFDALKNHFF